MPAQHLCLHVLVLVSTVAGAFAGSVPGAPACLLHLSLDGADSLSAAHAGVVGGRWGTGRKGQAWQTEGSTDHIAVPCASFFPRQAGTIEFSFRIEPGAASGARAVLFDCLGKPNWWNRFCGYLSMGAGGSQVTFTVVANKEVQFACDSIAKSQCDISPGVWHHYAATWSGVGSGTDDAEIRLFIDGVEVARLADQSVPVTGVGSQLWLGTAVHAPARAASHLPVALDEVRVWNGVLPVDAIARHAGVWPGAKPEETASMSSSVTIRPAVEPPRIDGSVDEKTWQFAQCITGLRDYHKEDGPAVPLQTTAWFAYDERNLYVAWRCGLATEHAKGAARPLDSAVFNDESVEFLFSHPADPGTLFHFIGNAYGSIYDEKLGAGGERDRAWSAPWEYQVRVVPAECWTGELRVPLSEMELAPAKPGDTWRINLAHNGFEPQYQSVWSHTTRSYADREALGTMRIAGPGPVVNGISLPELVVGENQLGVTYAGTAEDPMRLRVACMVQGANAEPTGSLWERRFDASTARKDVVRALLPTEGANRLWLRATDPATGAVLFSHALQATAAPPLSVSVTGEFPDGFARVDIDCRALGSGEYSGRVDLRTKAGESLSGADIAAFRNTVQVQLPLSGVQAGSYEVVTTLHTAAGAPNTRSVPFTVYAKPTCLSSTAGLGGVIAPWTPLARSGATVRCWNRAYDFGDGPLPRSIMSGGREILAAAPRFVWRSQDSRGELSSGTFTVQREAEDTVAFTGRLEDSQLRIDCTGEMAFDGAVFYDMTVSAKHDPGAVKDLSLEFRLTPESARYLLEGHAEHVRKEHNVLPTEPGGRVATSFMPMVAVCGEDRGLQWFCESDEGWLPYDRPDLMTIERQADAVVWRFAIRQGVGLAGPVRLRFGILPTPVKPLPRKRDGLRVVHFWPGGPVRTTPEAYYRPEVLDKVAASGANVITLHSYWADVFGSPRPYDRERFRAFVQRAHDLGLRVTVYMAALGHPDYPDALYYGDRWPIDPRAGFKARTWERKEVGSIVRCANSQSFCDWLCGGVEQLLRETEVDGLYYDWGCAPCRNHKHDCGYLPAKGSSLGLPEVGDEEVILGMAVQSLAGPWAAYRRTTPIRAQRELWMRLYRIVKDVRGERGQIIAHCDVPSHLVYASFTDGIWHSEDIACHMPTDWFPEPWFYRIFMSERHLGLDGELLTMVDHKTGPWQTQEKGLAVALVHNEWPRPRTTGLWGTLPPAHTKPVSDVWRALDAFGTEDESTQWLPYWTNGKVIESRAKGVLVSCWQKPDKAMLCVANWTNKETTATVTLLDPRLSVGHPTDAITGETIPAQDRTLSVRLPPAQMRLVLLTRE